MTVCEVLKFPGQKLPKNRNDGFYKSVQGATSAYLGYYLTYYQHLNTNYFSTPDIVLNYVQ